MKLYIKIFLLLLPVLLINGFVLAEDNTYGLLPQNAYGVLDIHGAPIPPKNPKDLLQVDVPHEDTVRVNLSTGKLTVKTTEFNVPCQGYDKELSLSFSRTYNADREIIGGNILGPNWRTNNDIMMALVVNYDTGGTAKPTSRGIGIYTNEGYAKFRCAYYNIDYYQPMNRLSRQTKIFKDEVVPEFSLPGADSHDIYTYIWQTKHGTKYYFEPYYIYRWYVTDMLDLSHRILSMEYIDYRLKKIEDRNGNSLEYTYLVYGGKLHEAEEAAPVTIISDFWPGASELAGTSISREREFRNYFGDDLDLEKIDMDEIRKFMSIRNRRPSWLTETGTGRCIDLTYYPIVSVDNFRKRGLLEAVTDPAGNVYSFDYIDIGELTGGIPYAYLHSVQKPCVSKPTIYTYNPTVSNPLSSITDPQNNTINIEYNGLVQAVSRVTSPDGKYFELDYFDPNVPRNVDVTYSDRPGVRLVYKFDHEGRLNGAEAWENEVKIWYEWYGWEDLRGFQFFTNLLSAGESGCGEHYLWTYEGDSENPVTHSMPGNRKKVYTYNEFHKVTKEELTSWSTGEVLRVTEFVYDVNGNLTSKIEDSGGPNEITTNYGYDEFGNRTRITDPNGNITTFTYDNYGNVFTSTDPEENITSFTYDINGNKLSETDARGNIIAYEYDTLNRLENITFPAEDSILEPPVKTYVYDDNSDVKSITDENGNTTEYQYDSNARLYREIDPLGYFVEYGYDSTGNTVLKKDKNAKTTLYGYDALNRKISEIDCLGETTTYSHGDLFTRCGSAMFEGSSFNPTAITNKRGNITEYQYNNRYWLQFIRYPGAEGYEEYFEYDVFGNKTLWIDTNGQFWRYYYDNVDRLVKQTDPVNYNIFYEYDNNGNKVSATDKRGNTTNFEYDGNNRLSKAIDPYFE
ncbi:MAG: RHS repeat protein, partial [Candidatus Aureabacteria bacterium]|nr:RHS repeat protein [Candidatus Auribacterota bacterium]